MRYVEMCSLTTCNAFALALAYGNGRPANAPSFNVVMVIGASRSENGVPASDSSSVSCMFAVAGDDESNTPPFRLGADRGNLDVESGSATSGKSCSSMRVMAARWEPASTAITEFLDQFVAVDRTRKPVTLSSLGPPPDPYSC
jgi:hypothetical protein